MKIGTISLRGTLANEVAMMRLPNGEFRAEMLLEYLHLIVEDLITYEDGDMTILSRKSDSQK